MTGTPVVAASVAEVPSLLRRLASFAYEGLILFGMLLIPGALGAVIVAITGQQHSRQSDLVLEVFSFLLYGAYFTWFWSARGQTLPMQTWKIRLVTADGQPVGRGRAAARYLMSWLWVAPAGVVATLNHWNVREQPRTVVACLAIGIAAYALLSLLLPQRQFLHDILCGTRLLTAPNAPRRSR
ncbi:RDD family protein [Sphaerotilaceae bacterium SBD11-9]